jgi:hypothetical protein
MTPTAVPRRYLMCRPTYFAVTYRINPWMDPTAPYDNALAVAQWENLRQTYLDLGHTVELIEPLPGLPDMVFAANGATVVDGKVLAVQFRDPNGPTRRRRTVAGSRGRLRGARLEAHQRGRGRHPAGRRLPAGRHRIPHRARRALQTQEVFGRPVITLQLVDPAYYHLDTALCVLDEHNVAYLPSAFSPARRRCCAGCSRTRSSPRRRTPRCSGLNAVSDGAPWCCRCRPPPDRRAARARLPDHRGRRVRAAQGRRRTQVLHAGGAFVTTVDMRTPEALADAERWTAHNYHPLPVVIAEAEGAWVSDVDGRRYLDFLAGYSALNFGPPAPRADRRRARPARPWLTLTSRAFVHDQFAGVLPTGWPSSAAREPGAADEHRRRGRRDRDKGGRKWGYRSRACRPGRPDHRRGRQLPRPYRPTIVSFSDLPGRRGRLRAVHARGSSDRAVAATGRPGRTRSPNTVAVLLELDPGVRPASWYRRPATSPRAAGSATTQRAG